MGYAYDAAGRVRHVTDPLGNVVSYGYDLRGKRTSRTSGEGPSTITETWSYDAAGREVASDRRDSQGNATMQSSVAYDEGYDMGANPCGLSSQPAPLGRVITRADASGRRLCIGYDDAGRVATESHTGGEDGGFDVSYGYDEAANTAVVSDSRQPGPWLRSYDRAGDLVVEIVPLAVEVAAGGGPVVHAASAC